jgi:hypothetical protein
MERISARWLASTFALLLLIAVGLSGCGRPYGSVSGKVTYQGKALSSGLVVFVDKDGKVTQPAGIEVDGSYVAEKVPVGQVTACVETLPLSGGDAGPNAAKDQPRPRYTPIPPKYKDAKQSELNLEVKPGPNTYDIELH